MNRTHFATLAFLLAALNAGHAVAADDSAPKTREQVKAELAEAIRTGDIVVGEGGEKANELYPSRYPAKPAVQGKTREQVKAELAEAIRTGDIVVGEGGEKANELYPSRYPAKPAVQGKTREQVKAELAEAIRTGDIVVGEGGEKANELYPSRYPAKPAVAQGLTREPSKAKPAASASHGEFNLATCS